MLLRARSRTGLALFALFAACTRAPGDGGADATSADAFVDSAQADTAPADTTPADTVAPTDAPACSGGRLACGGACVDVASDPANCGACGAACPPGASCVAGACACPGVRRVCGAVCADTATDAANCGACEHACAAGVPCQGGACVVCGAGRVACAGLCVDTATDSANCGACGHACPGTVPCGGSVCACPAGTTDCANACVDTTRDDANCGACGAACAPGTLCQGSRCVACAGGVALSARVQPVLTASCATATCHQAPVPAEDLDLGPGASYAQLVGVASEGCGGLRRVAPGDAAHSALVRVLLGAPCGDIPRMPLDGDPLATADIDAIRAWICEGAPDD